MCENECELIAIQKKIGGFRQWEVQAKCRLSCQKMR